MNDALAMDWLRKNAYGAQDSAPPPAADPDASAMNFFRSNGYTSATPKAAAQPANRSMASVPAAGFNAGVLTGLPGMPVDTALNVWDLLKAGAGYVGSKTGALSPDQLPMLTDRASIPGSSAWIAQKIRDAGGSSVIDNPMPDNPLARNLYSAGNFAGQAIVSKGAMDALPRGMVSPATPLYDQKVPTPTLDAAKNAAGAAASGYVGNFVGDATGDPAWAALATFAPPLAAMGPAYAARAVAGGGNLKGRQQIEQSQQDFRNAGVDPGYGLIKNNWLTQWLQGFAENTPGGSYYMGNAARDVQGGMGDKVKGLLGLDSGGTPLFPAVGPGPAGDVVNQAVQNYRTRQQDIYSRMNDRANALMSPDQVVPVTNTAGRVAEKFAPISGAPATSSALSAGTQKAYDLANALLTDSSGKSGSPMTWNGQAITQTPDGRYVLSPTPQASPQTGVPYSALTAIKSRMGDLAYPSNPLTADANQGLIKYLYGGLSADQAAAAQAAGPQAAAARARANSFYSGTQNQLGDVLSPLVRGADATPGNVYDRLASMARDQGSALPQTWASLPADARRAVTATVVDSLGRAAPGAQNAEGSQFSSNTFLTNWNKLSPEGKNALFSGFPEAPKLRSNMDDIAAAAERVNANAKAYTNPSKTAKTSAAAALGGAVFAGLMGNLPVAAGGAGVVGLSAITAKLMTNPGFVNWLAQAPKVPANALNGHIATLANWTQGQKDPQLKADATNYLRQLTQDLGGGVAPASVQ